MLIVVFGKLNLKILFVGFLLFCSLLFFSSCVSLPPIGGPECYTDSDCLDSYGNGFICSIDGNCEQCPEPNCDAPPDGCYYEQDNSARCPTCGELKCTPTTPPPTCNDKKQNGNEEGVDCGGTFCSPCSVNYEYEDLYGSRTKYSCDYYASPNGGGSGLSESSPFLIADFWVVNNIAGKTLCLIDGEYRGIESLIQPPVGLSGTENAPITIVALHDGKAFINGEGKKSPVFLDGNNWFVLEGFNAFNSSQAKKGDNQASVIRVEDSNDVILRRIVGWHAANGNTEIFSTDYARRIVREDCAGFGQSRTPGGNGHRSDSNSDTVQGKESNNVLRRFWGRTEYNTWAGQKGISVSYNTNGNIVENAIVTMNGYLTKQDSEGIGSSDHFGFHEDRGTDKNNRILGSIFYQTADQKIEGSDMSAVLNIRGENDEIEDFLSVIERDEPTSGDTINTGARLNGENFGNFKATHMTFIGGAGLNIAHGSNDIGNIIVQNINWNIGADTTGANINPGIAVWSLNRRLGGTPEYVMAWNNNENWNYGIQHYLIEDPDLIGRFGNLLQYGTAERPKVEGQPVGAQIACRYENGELTNKPLWPWPMEERIRVATCMYDNNLSREVCEQRTDLGVKVTKTVFELGGGSVPNFEELNPLICSDS